MIHDYLIKWQSELQGETIIRDAIDIRVTINKDAKSNSCEILVPYRQYTQDGDILFKSGESLQVYMKNNGLIDADDLQIEDLLFTATLLDLERQIQSGTIKLICGDLTYTLLSTLFNQDVTDTPDEIINLIIQRASQDGIQQITTNTNIQSQKSDSSAFDDVNFVSAWKTSYDCIAELSQTSNTGDDQRYLFWFDPDGTFNWIYPESDLETLEIIYGNGIKDIKHTRSDVETVSMVIYNAGPDLNGADTFGFRYNQFAETIKGSVRYYPMVDISKQLLKTSFATATNEEFIAEQQRQANAQADAVIKKYSGGIDKTTCELQGQHVNIAKLHKVSSPIFPQKELRLQRVVHTFNRNGWSTKLELEQDVREQ